jgi:DNA-binding CsgD family transcriptional regulator
MSDQNNLSGREIEILKLVATGLTNREIAQKLVISPNTVKVHLSNIFEKISVSSRTEATLYGIEHGIVDVPGGGEAPPVQTGWREVARRYAWVGIPALLLAMVLLIVLTVTVLVPMTTPEPQAMAELAERWRELAPMPAARAGLAAAAYDGEIYAIAGEGPEGVSGSVFRYTPETDTWVRLSDKPTPVADVHAALIGEKIYVPGGRLADGQPTDILEVYDPRRDTWGTGAPLPKPISAYALADFEGQMYLFGGWDGARALDDVYVYDPGVDAWREATPMATARQDAGAVALVDKIVVLGGRNEEGALKEAVGYFPSRDGDGEVAWEEFVDLPEERYGFGVANVSDTVYVIGGESEMEETDLPMGLFLSDTGWDSFPVNQEFLNHQTSMVSLGAAIIIFDTSDLNKETQAWSYQAFYYTIYIPFVP